MDTILVTLTISQLDTLTVSELDAMLITGGDTPVAADSGSYTLTGSVTGFVYAKNYPLNAEHGTYLTQARQIPIKADRAIPLETDVYQTTGHVVNLFLTDQRFISAMPGIYLTTGNDARVFARRHAPLGPGSYAQTGYPAILALGYCIECDTAHYESTGYSIDLDSSGLEPGDVFTCLGVVPGDVIVGSVETDCLVCI